MIILVQHDTITYKCFAKYDKFFYVCITGMDKYYNTIHNEGIILMHLAPRWGSFFMKPFTAAALNPVHIWMIFIKANATSVVINFVITGLKRFGTFSFGWCSWYMTSWCTTSGCATGWCATSWCGHSGCFFSFALLNLFSSFFVFLLCLLLFQFSFLPSPTFNVAFLLLPVFSSLPFLVVQQ